MKKPTIISILSGKGGTGKSIITASLGYLLSNLGFKTLLIDTDFFTNGLTYYILADNPRIVQKGLRDIFISQDINSAFPIEEIRNEYCNNNLFLLPSSNTRAIDQISELKLSESFSDISVFIRMMQRIFLKVSMYEFDYILIDTRGGSDLTSIGSAISAGSTIIVTEADKPSWDMGRVLLNTIEEAESKERSHVAKLGFILNKNVLPSEAIEMFLRKEWGCPHLVSIELDRDVITAFQRDKIPIVENSNNQFSYSIFITIEKIFINSFWRSYQIDKVKNKLIELKRSMKHNHLNNEKLLIVDKIGSWIRIYTLGLIAAISIYIMVVTKYDIFDFFVKNRLSSSIFLLLTLLFFIMPDIFRFLYSYMEKKRFG